MSTGPEQVAPVQTPGVALGVRPGVDLTRARLLATELEDEEAIRKLEAQ
jgi:hypothetical protein